MLQEMKDAYQTMQENWQSMQSSDFDSAAEDAERFERSFYKFVDAVQEWVAQLDPKPANLDALMALPELQAFGDELPAPLLINFETELELIMEGVIREQEEKYD